MALALSLSNFVTLDNLSASEAPWVNLGFLYLSSSLVKYTNYKVTITGRVFIVSRMLMTRMVIFKQVTIPGPKLRSLDAMVSQTVLTAQNLIFYVSIAHKFSIILKNTMM